MQFVLKNAVLDEFEIKDLKPTQYISLFLAVLAMVSCSDAELNLQALEKSEAVVVQRAEEVEMLYSDSAQILVRISGPVLLDYLDKLEPKTEFPEGVKVDFFKEGQTVNSILTAKYGIRYPKNNITVVRDSVVFKTVDGERLETEELLWDETKAKVYSNKFCRIYKKDEIIQGYGFESNESFTQSRIKKVTGRIAVDPIKP